MNNNQDELHATIAKLESENNDFKKWSKILFETTESICRDSYGDDDMDEAYNELEKLLK